MPIFLKPLDMVDELKGFRSVLIVSCPICPPMCVSIQQKKPFLQPLKHGLKTKAFEDYVIAIEEVLKKHGVRTDAFTMRFPVPMMCLWTERQRARIAKRARGFDAVLVLGCDSATYTAVDALKDIDCKVFQGMQVKSITNATTNLSSWVTVALDWHPLPSQPKIAKHAHGREDHQTLNASDLDETSPSP